MRKFLLFFLTLTLSVIARAEPFEIKDGDRVLFLGDTLLEREGTYGYLETRMAEQFPDRKFTVRNLAFSADTPLGWSRASFDPAAKGFERLKEQLALVKPTVVFLGYGMAASLQEMTDRSQDWTLNRDPARYGAEPMSAARFKKELAQCMDAINEGAPKMGAAIYNPNLTADGKAAPVRFVLLSPIRHEDLRATRPGLPDPTEHNKLLEQYTKAIEELAKERGARYVDLIRWNNDKGVDYVETATKRTITKHWTDNGIHLNEFGWRFIVSQTLMGLGLRDVDTVGSHTNTPHREALRAAIIRKNALFFHRWRPANETYLFGFRKREQGQNAVEIPKFDPLIEAAEAEIERLKKDASAQSSVPSAQSAQASTNPAPVTSHQLPVTSPTPAPQSTLPLPTFTLADGLEISLWAENPLLAKPTEVNWDAQGRLWVASSAMYPQIAPGQEATDKIIVLEDPGHTGKATKATVFADGLLIPTGVAPVLVSDGSAQSSVPSAQKNTAGAPSSLSTDALSTEHSAPARWACYVGQSTEILYFEDTDGDGKADKKRIVFSGFGTEDTHHIVHTLRWGPDGRLYFSQSVYIHTHMETPWGVVRVNSGGVFAYDPRTERVEVVEKGLWNTWGHAWDKWGQAFYTDGAGSTGLSWGFPGATFAPNEGARRTMASISPGSYPKFAGLELIYSPHFPADWQGTAVTNDFRAHKVVHFKINDLSAEGKSGYVTEQLPVLVQTSDATFRPIDVKLGPDGALYIADWSNPIINHGEVDFRDPRRDHEHGRIWRLSMKGGAAVKWESLVGKKLEELAEGVFSKSAWASANSLSVFRSQLSGVLDKVKPSGGGWTNYPPLTGVADDKTITKQPESPFDPFMKGSRAVMAAHEGEETYSLMLLDLASGGSPFTWDDASKNKIRLPDTQMTGNAILHDTYLILGNGTVSSRYRKSSDINARTAWVRQIGESIRNLGEDFVGISLATVARPALIEQIASVVGDPSPRVRLEAMRALARIPATESASLILKAAINAPKDDPQYEFAAWLSINDLAEVWTKAVLAGEWKPEGREKQFEFALNAIEPALAGQVLSQFVSTGRAPLDGSGPWIELIGNTGGPGELRPLLDALLAAAKPDRERPTKPLADEKWKFKTPGANARAAAALVAAARRGVKPAGDAAGQLAPAAFFTSAPTDALPDVLRLAGLWRQNVPAAIFATLDARASAPVLDAAFEALRTLATPEAADFLTAYFDPAMEQKLNNAPLRKVIAKSDNNWRIHALLALAPLRPGDAMKHLDTVLAETPEPQRVNVWRTLFAEGPFMQKFMQSIPANFPPATAATALRAARELGRRGQPLVAKLSPLAGEKAATKTGPANYADLGVRAKKDGDPVAGEAIYRRMASACTTCHAIGGAGGKLGPDLTSIGASAPPDYIIESVLDPAAKVKEGYHAFTFKMKDGSEAIGIPSRETAQEQFIRTIAGEQGLSKANIVSKKLAEGGASLMPAGLTAAWTDRERLNLYAFLMELGRPGPFDASKNNVARVWQLTYTRITNGVLKAEVAESIPSIPAYTLVDGRLTKDLLAEKLAMLAPKKDAVHLTARFQAASAGKAKLNLTGIRKAWLDGQPLAIASEPSPTVDLSAGAHTFTVEVDAKSPPDVLRLESPAASFLGD